MNRRRLVLLCAASIIAALFVGACGGGGSGADAPTAVPTVGPPPGVGSTVTSPNWQVRVTDVETGTAFSSFSIPGERDKLIIVTLDYTYVGPGSYDWSPESVVLLHVGLSHEGWGQVPRLYRGETSQVVDVSETSLIKSLQSGVPHHEVVVFQFRKELTDFRLYFPETQAIAIELDGGAASAP